MSREDNPKPETPAARSARGLMARPPHYVVFSAPESREFVTCHIVRLESRGDEWKVLEREKGVWRVSKALRYLDAEWQPLVDTEHARNFAAFGFNEEHEAIVSMCSMTRVADHFGDLVEAIRLATERAKCLYQFEKMGPGLTKLWLRSGRR